MDVRRAGGRQVTPEGLVPGSVTLMGGTQPFYSEQQRIWEAPWMDCLGFGPRAEAREDTGLGLQPCADCSQSATGPWTSCFSLALRLRRVKGGDGRS